MNLLESPSELSVEPRIEADSENTAETSVFLQSCAEFVDRLFPDEYPNYAPTSLDEFSKLTADKIVNQRFIGLPAEFDVLAVQSDIATGKTKSMISAAKAADGVVYLVSRERLAENLSREAERIGVPIENYKSLSKADRRLPARIAYCVNSYSDLANEAPGLVTRALLELDEFEQLLDHIYGDAGTFTKRGAIEAAEALKYIIQNSPSILVMDAHLSDLAIAYLRAQGRSVFTLVNEHVTARGPLTIHKKRDGAVAQGEALVAAHEGVVVFAVASAEFAEVLATELENFLGNSRDVLLLTAENGGGVRQTAFFADPNGQIGLYRAVVYSPVIGTGFDITTPVRAVIGIMAPHLSANDARQMIGRCRNTAETHVYIPGTHDSRETDAVVIETLELEKAEHRISKLNENGVRVPGETDADQRDYLHWHSQITARRNWSINHFREHFVYLCKGYSISYSDRTDAALSEKLVSIKNELEYRKKELVLVATPVDADTFRQCRDAGLADENVIAGHLRYLIEWASGTSISPTVRDQLWTPEQRQQLCRFTDLFDDVHELQLADAHEQLDGLPLPKRRMSTSQRIVTKAVLDLLIDDSGTPCQLLKQNLEDKLKPVTERYYNELKVYFDWRPKRCTSAAGIIRRVLATIGMELASEQVTIAQEHVRYYTLDAFAFRQMQVLAESRLTMLREQRKATQDARYGRGALDSPRDLKSAKDCISR